MGKIITDKENIKAKNLKSEKRVFGYWVGIDYIHVYDNRNRSDSSNPLAIVHSETDAQLIVDALTEYHKQL